MHPNPLFRSDDGAPACWSGENRLRFQAPVAAGNRCLVTAMQACPV